ncbi:hypothetical protein BD309DRAFT_962108 [Dichomitus squalens]|uniref:Uncharacterized protein n=1 Tax=Dichomitus squalens TaxID=114155 RepID=A0A4Q9NS25_9APHY|nr:hypothetical protein BD309DRAFT_962108 [Dichomitus squalens]TBU53204.1 hypothetical protein BD310DRAFT_938567 [Dichomitus squalens]
MVSLTLTSPRSSTILSSSSRNSITHVSQSPSVPPSPSSSVSAASTSSSSSSSGRMSRADDEDATVTFKRASIMSNVSQMLKGKDKSTEDLRILAAQQYMTELTYAISDIQTRIFEIQELRHRTQSSGDVSNATSVDHSLAALDERLASVATGIKTVNESLEPLLGRAEQTPTLVNPKQEEEAAILRVHAALLADWEAVQKDIQVLREELKEDKWLTVFRTVTDQADGMMSSLEKAVNRCQDFMWQVQKRGLDENLNASNSSSSGRSDRASLNYETFIALLESFEAKKKHYMPATTKVLSIIDKGVQDRVTKNGECLRRHAECTQRWRNLKERISRTDSDMEHLRRLFLHPNDSALSSGGSSHSGNLSVSKNGYLVTPPSGEKKGRSPSTNTLSRSISPFRKIARKLKGASGTKSPSPGNVTPLPPKSPALSRMPSSEPARTLRHRTSMFTFLNGGQPLTPTTPDRPSHKYSASLTPDNSPSKRGVDANATLKNRPAWNSSTKVQPDERSATIKQSSRRPSVSSTRPRMSSDDIPPVPQMYKRSLSRSSMASSRPWSPVTSTSTAQSSTTPFSMYRPPSRSHTPGLSYFDTTTVSPPRTRPKTPSHIPTPSTHLRSLSSSVSSANSSPSRALSPTTSISGQLNNFPARPPSRSMIPIPSVHIQGASRPGTAMSYRPDSAMSFRGFAARAATPEGLSRMTPRPRAPPSSFRDGTSPRTPASRPSSRAGAETPDWHGEPVHYYAPGNHRDPLDMEVATIVNSIPHSMIVERIDPPLKQIPKEGEEVRAQYAFSNQLGRKVVTCKLATMTRSGKGTTKKVMCRVGGGWQDLRLYIMTRQGAA